MYNTFSWSEEYSVNIKEIDDQHKEFFALCNNLLDLAHENRKITRDEAVISVNKLGDYAFYHLGTEEELFFEYRFPDLEAHIKMHQEFRTKVDALIKAMRNVNSDINETLLETARFASSWLQGHILSTDKKYSEFFNEHGIR